MTTACGSLSIFNAKFGNTSAKCVWPPLEIAADPYNLDLFCICGHLVRGYSDTWQLTRDIPSAGKVLLRLMFCLFIHHLDHLGSSHTAMLPLPNVRTASVQQTD